MQRTEAAISLENSGKVEMISLHKLGHMQMIRIAVPHSLSSAKRKGIASLKYPTQWYIPILMNAKRNTAQLIFNHFLDGNVAGHALEEWIRHHNTANTK